VTGVLGAVSQYCAGFEDSKKPRHLTVNVGSDTSVLLYHVPDVSSSNIPMVIDDQVLQLEPKGFGICTETKASQGHCDAVGTFTVKFDDTHYGLINKFAHAGEKVELTISREGLYCVVTYQQRAKLSHIKVVEKHSYGYLPLPLYETMKVFLVRVALLVMTLWALMYTFKGERRANMGIIYEDIAALIVTRWNQVGWKILALKIQNLLGTDQPKFVSLKGEIDISYMVLTFMIYDNLSAHIFDFKKEEMEKMTSQAMLRKCILGGTLVSVAQLPQRLFPSQLSVFIDFLSEAIISIVWMHIFTLKNIKITQRKMVDPVFAENYQRSKLCLLSIPIAVSLVSFGCVMIVLSVISNESLSRLGGFGNDMKGSFTSVLEPSLNQNFLFVLLRRSEYSMLFLQYAFLFIWRPHLRNRVEFEDIHGCKLPENGRSSF
jgi:hypothetical protein